MPDSCSMMIEAAMVFTCLSACCFYVCGPSRRSEVTGVSGPSSSKLPDLDCSPTGAACASGKPPRLPRECVGGSCSEARPRGAVFFGGELPCEPGARARILIGHRAGEAGPSGDNNL